jgi:uncharacterized membrane protein YgdD (TMEM256/DUF423 family)
MIDQFFFIVGSLSAAIAVIFGAFGAHLLKKRLPVERLESFETGVRYQMYHALALLGASFATVNWSFSILPVLAGWLFILGTLLFSGSLYLLSLTGKRWLGMIAPIGGVAFILGWLCLVLIFWGI